ncbi:MAG TPA: hypothetical protein VFT65_12515 [Candidatus Angelobacter sp.]|nr:hypothetical protein [Candidatus Angelobacter sp.]
MQNTIAKEIAPEKSRITPIGAANRPLTANKYRPTGPPKAERRKQVLRQALQLPKTLRAIYRIVREDLSPAALDDCLWAFWGFHQENWDAHYRMRPWEKAQLGAIETDDVVGGLAVWEMALMMTIAMEDEDPIMEYTQQSGEGFRFLLPTLGRFMGKNEEEARYGAEHGVPWCEGAWCAEERRHSNAFARIIERLMGVSPSRENPNQPMVVTADEESAVQHIISRQTTEWNASSSYIVMTAHAAGDLRTLTRNMARDEIKHLCILSSADTYLFGPRPWRRLVDLVKLGIRNYRRQRAARSGGALLGSNWALAVEGIASHLLTAFYLTRWLRTVPLRTLTTVFETPSQLAPLAAFKLTAERRTEVETIARNGEARRRSLGRWESRQGDQALQQRWFEDNNASLLENLIANDLDGFRGAETPGSTGEKEIVAQIKRISADPIRAALLDLLRDYQIRNNRHVRERSAKAITVMASRMTGVERRKTTKTNEKPRNEVVTVPLSG